MKKSQAFVLVFGTAIIMIAICYFLVWGGPKPDVTNPTQQTEQVETQPTEKPTEPKQEHPTESTTEENVDPLDQYTISRIIPTHAPCKDGSFFKNKLPSNNTESCWWNEFNYLLVSSIEDLSKYEDFAAMSEDIVKSWDEVKHVPVNTLLDVNGDRALIFVSKNNIANTETSALVFRGADDKTIKQAIQEGYWSYAKSDASKDALVDLFGEESTKTAKQIVDRWGVPSEIYYSEFMDGMLVYMLEYDMVEYSVVVACYEIGSDIDADISGTANIIIYGKNMQDVKEEAFSKMEKLD